MGYIAEAPSGKLNMYGAGDAGMSGLLEKQRLAEVDVIDLDPLFLAVYGAGTFIVAASDEVVAADIAVEQRRQVSSELALPLVMPIPEDKASDYRRVNLLSNGFQVYTQANPRVVASRREKQPSDPVAAVHPKQGKLFSWWRHGRTNHTVYKNYNE